MSKRYVICLVGRGYEARRHAVAVLVVVLDARRLASMANEDDREAACGEAMPIDVRKFFFDDTATAEIYTSLFVGSVRCV